MQSMTRHIPQPIAEAILGARFMPLASHLSGMALQPSSHFGAFRDDMSFKGFQPSGIDSRLVSDLTRRVSMELGSLDDTQIGKIASANVGPLHVKGELRRTDFGVGFDGLLNTTTISHASSTNPARNGWTGPTASQFTM
jgi:hypothetical protein